MRGVSLPWFNPRTTAIFGAALLLAFASSFESRPAAAAGPVTRTWTGAGGDNSWTNNGNWDPAAPSAGDILVFPEVAARKANSNTFPNFTSFSDIRFEGDGYTISGNRVLVSGEVWNTPLAGTNTIGLILDGGAAVRNSSGRLNLLGANSHAGPNSVEAGVLHAGHSNAFGEFNALVDAAGGVVSLGDGLSIFNPLIIGSPESPILHANGNAGWSGPVTIADHSRFDVAPGATLRLAAPVSGPLGVVKTGPGTLVLEEVNTYQGVTEIKHGTLRVTRTESLGTNTQGTVVEDGATLEVAGANLPAEHLELNGQGADGLGALRSQAGIVILGNVSAGSDSTIRVDSGTVRLENGLEPEISNYTVTKTGAGKLEIEGGGAFDGFIVVDDGELSVRGAVKAKVDIDGGSITGDGSVARLSVLAGTLEPGVQGQSALDIQENLFLAQGSTAKFAVNAGSHSSVRVGGTFTPAGAHLVFTGTGGVPPNTAITLVENLGGAPINGIFLGQNDGAVVQAGGNDFRLSYDGGPLPANDLVITSLEGVLPADLALEVLPELPVVPAGSVLKVVYRAFNLGPGTVPGARLAITVESGATFASLEVAPGWLCVTPNAGQGGLVICERLAWPPAGAGEPADFTLRLNIIGADGLVLPVGALLTHDGVEEGDGFNNHILKSVTIGPVDPLPFKLRVPLAARDGVN